MRCKLTLPFNGAFAHVVYMSGLSAVAGLFEFDPAVLLLFPAD